MKLKNFFRLVWGTCCWLHEFISVLYLHVCFRSFPGLFSSTAVVNNIGRVHVLVNSAITLAGLNSKFSCSCTLLYISYLSFCCFALCTFLLVFSQSSELCFVGFMHVRMLRFKCIALAIDILTKCLLQPIRTYALVAPTCC